jgi:hypothetical protein
MVYFNKPAAVTEVAVKNKTVNPDENYFTNVLLLDQNEKKNSFLPI